MGVLYDCGGSQIGDLVQAVELIVLDLLFDTVGVHGAALGSPAAATSPAGVGAGQSIGRLDAAVAVFRALGLAIRACGPYAVGHSAIRECRSRWNLIGRVCSGQLRCVILWEELS